MQPDAEPGSVEHLIDAMSATPDVPGVEPVIPDDPVNLVVDATEREQAGSGHEELTVPLHDTLRSRAERRGTKTEQTDTIIAESALQERFAGLPPRRQAEVVREQLRQFRERERD